MKFVHALEQLLHDIIFTEPLWVPVYAMKTDLSDGFFHIDLNADDVPELGLLFPRLLD